MKNKEMHQTHVDSGLFSYDGIMEIAEYYWDLIHDSGAYAVSTAT